MLVAMLTDDRAKFKFGQKTTETFATVNRKADAKTVGT